MNIIESTQSALSKIITWKGRASRSEFWWFYLVYVLVYIILMWIASYGVGFLNFLCLLAYLALVVAFLSCTVRRLHDVGFSGWWYWIAFAPFVIDRNDNVEIVELLLKYGANPTMYLYTNVVTGQPFGNGVYQGLKNSKKHLKEVFYQKGLWKRQWKNFNQ